MEARMSASGKNARFSVAIANGSPRSDTSLTLRFVRLMADSRAWPRAEFACGRDGDKAIAESVEAFLARVAEGAMPVWSYPVYCSGVPSQFMAFLDALAAHPRASILAGKPFAQVLSSKRFFDVTAMEYVRAVSADLGMIDYGALSTDPAEFMEQRCRDDAVRFAERLEWAVGAGVRACAGALAPYPPAGSGTPRASAGGLSVDDAFERVSSRFSGTGPSVLVLCDDRRCADSVGTACFEFLSSLGDARPDARVELLSLSESSIRVGCAGCLSCVIGGECPINDGYAGVAAKCLDADAIVYAGRVRGRWFDRAWKRYDDRGFRFGHRASMRGKPVAWLVGGPFRASAYLPLVIESRAYLGGTPLAALLETDYLDAAELARRAKEGAASLARHLAYPTGQGEAFWSVGGMRIFRDLVYEMRGFMREDHRFYKRHGLYDFPQARRGSIVRGYIAGAAMSLSAVRKRILPRLARDLADSYDRIIERDLRERASRGDRA
jgi:multimeric flavodoxin WrbA